MFKITYSEKQYWKVNGEDHYINFTRITPIVRVVDGETGIILFDSEIINENQQIQQLKLAEKLAIAAKYVINNNDMLDLGNRICYLKKCLNRYKHKKDDSSGI